MNKKILSLFIALITAMTSFTAAMAQTSYTDVADTAPYAEAVEYCRENGLMMGTSDTEFSPDENTSRAMLVTILHRYSNSPITNEATSFLDVEEGSWYYDAVCWATDTGIVEGYDSEHFGPLDILTKEQILSVLWRTDGENQINDITLPYSDASSISPYAVSAVNWAYANNIIDNENEALEPQSAIKRSDMAVILYRYLNMPKNTPDTPSAPDSTEEPEETTQADLVVPDVHVRFDNTEFDVVLYDSATKDLLMSQLSESEMMLPPSYDMDNVCKYYDIPSRYLTYMGIETEEITHVKAGDLIINDEGRLFLYYKGSDIQGEYMRVGYVYDMTGLAEALGDGQISFYVSQYSDSELSSESVSSNNINLTNSVTQLENGFSAVRYDGDDLFDKFIEQGGASSDSEVISFLQKEIGSNMEGLGFDFSGFACSTLAADGENGDKLFGRNFDWNTCNALVTVSHPSTGYSSIATVNTDFIRTAYGNSFDSLPEQIRTLVALYAPLDGMNEKGLCAAVLMIQDSDTVNQNTQKPDITTTTAIRMLLNKASTTDEAVELLEQYDFHPSFGYMIHFAISDANGKNVAVEYVNNEMIVTETPVLTNFYVALGSKNGVGTEQSHTRFEILQNILNENKIKDMSDMKDAMETVSKKNFSDGTTTEWSIVYNKATGTALYYHRENFDKSYNFNINL
jgi:predicted choloylglycine hydrolase